MAVPLPIGPDIVLAGAARSGTSFLASLLGSHPDVDPGAVKEPNYFSREHARGPDWYDGLFAPRRPGLLRLDASMSYTFKHFPDALPTLVREAPDAVVIYAVRHPLRRLLSHYHLHREYFRNEKATTLGDALAGSEVYAGASDYAHWLEQLTTHVDPERLLVVPFPVVTGRREELCDVLCDMTGLDPAPFRDGGPAREEHRNQVVQFRNEGVRRARRLVRRAGLYPAVRRSLGRDRLRRLRSWGTRPVTTEKIDEALATCSPAQLDLLRELHESARAAVGEALATQDERRGLTWADTWVAECPPMAVRRS